MKNKVTFTSTSASNFLGTISQTYFDRRIQRRSVWKKKNKEGYLKSVLDGHSIHPFIICDISSCLNYCRGLGEKYVRDCEYFQKLLDKGYQYISIDGGNRSDFFSKYFEGVPVTSMTNEQREVSNATICVTEILRMTKSELHLVALRTNEGEPWNDQEQRNSIDSYVSDFVRKISDDMSKVSPLISAISIDRLGDDSLYSTFLCYWQNSYADAIKKQQINEMYKNESINESDEFLKIINLWGECVKCLNSQLECKLTKSFVFNLFVFLVETKRHYGLNLNKNLISKFIRVYYNLDESRIKNTYNPITKRSSWAEINRNITISLRNKFQTIYSDFQSEIETYFFSKDSKRIFNNRDKTSAYCEERVIEGATYMESIDGNKIHADHTIRHIDGGKTVVENCMLISKTENLKKANTPTI